VRREREARGWSLRELAQAAALTPTTVHRLEKGASPPRLDSVIAIADALGVAVCDLLGDEFSRPKGTDTQAAAGSLARAERGDFAHEGAAALTGDPHLSASLGLKRAEVKQLWDLATRLAQVGISLNTPVQAIRAVDLLRSLTPEGATETSTPPKTPAEGRQRGRRPADAESPK